MITLRRAGERGHAVHGWLDSFHSFSFADYHDPRHMGFGALRVINEDRVAPGMGFGMHGHRDMEILTYVLDGTLQHRDDMGNGSIIARGDMQRMSAGTGIRHSEFNPSKGAPVHFLQIWIEPSVRGIAPGCEQAHLEAAAMANRLALVAAPAGAGGLLVIHQDAFLHAMAIDGAVDVTHALAPDRRAYVQVARGRLSVNGEALLTGDAAKIENESSVRFDDAAQAEILLFDLK